MCSNGGVHLALYTTDPISSHIVCFSSLQALSLYRSQAFKEAIEMFNEVLAVHPADKASKMFIGRCTEFIADPPADGALPSPPLAHLRTRVGQRHHPAGIVLTHSGATAGDDWDGVYRPKSK